MSTFHQLSASADAAVFPPAFGQLPASLRSGTPRHFQFTKGSVESLLEISESVWVNAAAEPLDPGWKTRIEKAVEQLGREGMRVLGVAFREVAPPGSSGSLEERNMTFIGLLGMHDPPRAEAKDALRVCREAGVRVHMVTGDHPTTAQAIAKELGMSHAHVLTGAEIHGMSVQELAGVIETVPIFARVAPEHKLKIVEALKLNGHVVAMTGDGVNDAPALKRADIGVAMGITGTDVSREAADMVLLDDNFATIVIAIQEGRTIYDNIKKFANYLLTTNAAEVGVMLLGPLLGMPIPLLPLQILWINLVTDGPPALSLGVEPSEAGVMRRTPRHPSESLVDRAMAWRIGWVGLLMVTLALAPAYGLWRQGGNHWQSFLFATLVFAQMAHVLAIHSGEESIFTRAPARNVALYMSLVGVGALQFFVLLSPFMQGLMKIVALSPAVIGTCLLLSSVVLIAIEVEKWHLRRRRGLIL